MKRPTSRRERGRCCRVLRPWRARGAVPATAQLLNNVYPSLLTARGHGGAPHAAQGQPHGRGAGFRRLPTDLEGGVVECRATASLSGVGRNTPRLSPATGDAGGRAALPPLHARQQNNIGSIGRRMDSPAAAPPSPREGGAAATPPRRSPPRVSAPPLRHRCDRPSPPCCFAVVPWCLRCYSDLPLFAAL